jgi:6-phospho-beta-glucosidase
MSSARQRGRRRLDTRRRWRRISTDPTHTTDATCGTGPTDATHPTCPTSEAPPMKVAVIGGAGVRTPLLAGGLTASDLPIEQIALYDVDQRRLATIGAVAERMISKGRVTLSASVAECVASADVVFTSIRVGGIEQRIHDEAVAQAHGIVGQETVGPAGFAMAMRTIPPMVQYARQIAEAAPKAWIVNFTNPVGMVTEAMRTVSDRVIGICDTPTELFEEVARALGLDSETCVFDYFGLNHLGWLREVYSGGEPQLHRLWRDAELLRKVYKVPLFEAASLKTLELLPTEYVYYYDQPARAFTNVQRAGRSRGQVIEELTGALFDALAAPDADLVAIYKSYLRTRSAGYMQIESGAEAPSESLSRRSHGEGGTGLSGYDRIALGVLRAIHFNANTIIPLSVANRGNIECLRANDVVEVPCVVNANGARPLHVGPVPDRIVPLLTQVKDYERLTVRAALTPSPAAARAALARNPLVPDEVTAATLIDDLSPLW